jgi:hypothetical protein
MECSSQFNIHHSSSTMLEQWVAFNSKSFSLFHRFINGLLFLWVVFPTSTDQFIIIMTSLSKLSTFNLQHRMFVNIPDAPPNSLKYSNVSLKVNTTEEGVGVCSLIHSILGVRGACQNSGIGTRMSDKWINYSYGRTQTNNKLVHA